MRQNKRRPLTSLKKSTRKHFRQDEKSDTEIEVTERIPATPESLCFVSTWQTDKDGGSSPVQVRLPLEEGGSYSFRVDWGDGTEAIITGHDQPQVTHTYPRAGLYTLRIFGTIRGFRFGDFFGSTNDREKLISISKFGQLNVGNEGQYFCGCSNLTLNASDGLDLAGTSNLNGMFHVAHRFNGDISTWDVSGVTNMSNMFSSTDCFDGDISSWNVNAVTNMSRMFQGAKSFNCDISNWNVGAVTNMHSMFQGATSFNQDISSWNVRSVIDLRSMFCNAYAFNQDISSWEINSLANIRFMFANAKGYRFEVPKFQVVKIPCIIN